MGHSLFEFYRSQRFTRHQEKKKNIIYKCQTTKHNLPTLLLLLIFLIYFVFSCSEPMNVLLVMVIFIIVGIHLSLSPSSGSSAKMQPFLLLKMLRDMVLTASSNDCAFVSRIFIIKLLC